MFGTYLYKLVYEGEQGKENFLVSCPRKLREHELLHLTRLLDSVSKNRPSEDYTNGQVIEAVVKSYNAHAMTPLTFVWWDLYEDVITFN